MMTDTITSLIEELRHPDKNVRGKAALSLGKLGDTALLDTLLNALSTEPDLFVREDLTWALVRIGGEALEPLIDLLYNTNAAVRHHAAHVLGKIADGRAVEALMRALQDTDAAVVSKAAFGLRQIGDERAIPALVAIVGHENRDVQTMLIDVLEHFGASSVEPLMALMTSERGQVREQAADILGQIGDKRALPVLIEALKDEAWQVRFAAVTALGHMGGAEAKAALQAMPDDVDDRVRTLVAKVIKRMKR